ncbi:MAG: carboxy-S-adenosyl-L-methionine synthase CmoA [Oleispira sp.]|nr:carboxy-S-adenosyl-L-methionine synthase CmoA [Oleispira sp.]MBL4881036.1 carboxy-S-adenosyl-L-methionine synthase CmoA [Oleispira sp.]
MTDNPSNLSNKPSLSSNDLSSADDIYADSAGEQLVGQFTFDSAVARVFPDMIRRSVPGYAETVAMSGVIAGEYARDNTQLYDLGCSLGAVTLAMRHGVKAKDCKILAVDNSEAMIEQAGHYLALDDGSVDVELACADITQIRIENASVVALNYVLQFIPKDQRLGLLSNIAQGLNLGGALILSEKICFSADEQKLQDKLHLDFKRANGYSELEIAQKRSAIENVLVPETDEDHVARLQQAGFSRVIRWYQCFNFVSYLAIK